jgi:Ca2+-binding EF-hand superfamily protein
LQPPSQEPFRGKTSGGTERIGSRDIPLSEIAELKLIFDSLDNNRSGQVDMSELKKVFIALGLDGR